MAVTIVQSRLGSSPTTNPTLRVNGVVAGNTLLTLCSQASTASPTAPTDNQGDAFSYIQDMVFDPSSSSHLSMAVYDTLRAVGGNTTLTFPTVAPSQCVAVELSGVRTPPTYTDPRTGQIRTKPDYDIFAAIQGTTDIAGCDAAISGPNGGLALALLAASGTISPTLTSSGWTALSAPVTSQGLTIQAASMTSVSPTQTSVRWSLGQSTPWLVIYVSFDSA